jgi:hypothetical protein
MLPNSILKIRVYREFTLQELLYNSHNDTFYMIVTAFSGGLGNIVKNKTH